MVIPDGPGVAGAQRSDSALRAALPSNVLAEVLEVVEDTHADDQQLEATRYLLQASRRALKSGKLRLAVPPALAGGRLGWHASAGDVRALAAGRLEALVNAGSLAKRDAKVLVVRFGLDGYPQGARDARAQSGRARQATTDAVNRAIRTLAADIAMQPLLPVERPSLTRARREEIVGTVLSTLHGPANEGAMRQYIHARVRHELLGDTMAAAPSRSPTERQRWNRSAHEWIAIVSDHLDRDRLPWAAYPIATVAERRELRDWGNSRDRASVTLSVGALRALSLTETPPGLTPMEQGLLFAMLADGYRPLIELTRLAQWAISGDERDAPFQLVATEGHSGRYWQRADVLINVAYVVALRGYHNLAVCYAGHAAQFLRRAEMLEEADRIRGRFISGLVFESLSFLKGSASINETRAWQRRLASDLDRYTLSGEYVLAVAQAIIRSEHAALLTDAGSGRSVAELLAPLSGSLDDAIIKSHPESRARLAIVMKALGERIGDKSAVTKAETSAPRDLSPQPAVNPRSPRYDEWYRSFPAAHALWDPRPERDYPDDWRR